jgi:hypothetical protein
MASPMWPPNKRRLIGTLKVFIPLWLIGAGVNMALGVKRGYSVREEIPFFLLVFAVPAVVALFIAWGFTRG